MQVSWDEAIKPTPSRRWIALCAAMRSGNPLVAEARASLFRTTGQEHGSRRARRRLMIAAMWSKNPLISEAVDKLLVVAELAITDEINDAETKMQDARRKSALESMLSDILAQRIAEEIDNEILAAVHDLQSSLPSLQLIQRTT